MKHVDSLMHGLFVACVVTVIVALAIKTKSEMDYNTQLIQAEFAQCNSDPQYCDPNLYSKYHR